MASGNDNVLISLLAAGSTSDRDTGNGETGDKEVQSKSPSKSGRAAAMDVQTRSPQSRDLSGSKSRRGTYTTTKGRVIGKTAQLGEQSFLVGDVVRAIDAQTLFRGEKHNGTGIQTVNTGKDQVYMRVKYRPAVIVRIFEDHFHTIPLYTHGGKLVEVVATKPEARREVMCLLRTSSSNKNQQKFDRDFVPPPARQLYWNHVDQPDISDDAVLYLDYSSTIHGNSSPAPEKIGRLEEESCNRLIGLWIEVMTGGRKLATPTALTSPPRSSYSSRSGCSASGRDTKSFPDVPVKGEINLIESSKSPVASAQALKENSMAFWTKHAGAENRLPRVLPEPPLINDQPSTSGPDPLRPLPNGHQAQDARSNSMVPGRQRGKRRERGNYNE